jgi:hypothetical protein
MARRAWQDSTFGFLGLLLVYLTCQIMRSPDRKLLYGAFFAAGTFCLLIKETAYVSFGLCGLWLAVTMSVREKSWKRALIVITGGAASLAATLGIWVLLAGSLTEATSSVFNMLDAAFRNTYAIENYSGPWHQFFYLLWITGPFTAAMAVVGLCMVIALLLGGVRTTLEIVDARPVALAAAVAVVFISLASFGPNLQNLRIVSPASGAYCLLAGFGFRYILRLAAPRVPKPALLTVIAAALLFVAAARDYRAFTRSVVVSGMQDLAVRGIRQTLPLQQ